MECTNPVKNNNKFCSLSCNSIYQNSIRTSNLVEFNSIKSQNLQQLYYNNPKKCEQCDNIIDYERRLNKFCNHSCAAIFNNSKRGVKKIPISRKRPKTSHNVKPLKDKLNICKIKFINCAECNNLFCLRDRPSSIRVCCSKRCGVLYGAKKGGKKSAEIQSKRRRSKNEIYFSELCSAKFEIFTNKSMFNGWDADVVIPKFKLAILWNGAWHRKKITKKHSVEQVKNRDKIKIKEIIKCGFIPYIIEDDGKYKPIFVEQMFDLLTDFINIHCEVV